MAINALHSLKHAALLSASLWQRLMDPVEHPLFQKTVQTHALIRMQWRIVIAVVVLVMSSWICNLQVRYALFEPGVLLLILTFTVVGSSLYAGTWAFEISAALAKERRQHTYDLLCVLPSGARGVDWAIGAACLHRRDTLAWIDWLRRAFTGLLLFLFLIVLLFTGLIAETVNLTQMLSLVLDVTLLVMVSYTEHTQAVLLGTLLAILLSHHNKLHIDVQFLAVISFLALQVLTLVMALSASQWIALSWRDALLIEPQWSGTLAVGLLIFHFSRKGLIAILWWRLNYEWGD